MIEDFEDEMMTLFQSEETKERIEEELCGNIAGLSIMVL